jgi:phenylpropionate dioxygenase-like ring-hydroxylating dioxygenase large terminal subunit
MNKATSAEQNTANMSSEPLAEPMIFGTEAYLSKDDIALERDKLWRKVWLQAGRVEELPDVGSYITYEILDDSILIVRTAPDTIRAYHNVCQHRGRRLVDTPEGRTGACGKTKQFVCGFHGWRWDLNGENTHILDKEDWKGCLTGDNTRLPEVKCDTWGGWIWINMDTTAGSLQAWLGPIPGMLDPFELQNMRFKWRRWAIFDCNWKVAMEAFNEAYHVQATHPEFMRFGIYDSWARVEGLHAVVGYDAPKNLDETASRVRLGKGNDPRASTAEMVDYTMKHVNSNFTQTLWDVAMRLEKELPEGTPADQVLKYWLETSRRIDAERGAVWPTVDPAHVKKSGFAWQVFPNFRIGHGVNNGLCYHGRPYGYDPDKCIFEVSVFELYPKGQEPQTQWEFTPLEDARWGSVLPQDFSNMAAVQQGMKSLGFKGPRPNPKEERAVTALHDSLAKWFGREGPRPLK